MATVLLGEASIIIDQATLTPGVAGYSRDDGVIGQLVTLRNANAGNENVKRWQWILLKPRASAAVLSAPKSASCSFTPDSDGTYSVILLVNEGRAALQRQRRQIAVKSAGGFRYPGQGESNEANWTSSDTLATNETGWWEDMDRILRANQANIDGTLLTVATDPGLLNSRRLQFGDGITSVDGGPGGDLTISVSPGYSGVEAVEDVVGQAENLLAVRTNDPPTHNAAKYGQVNLGADGTTSNDDAAVLAGRSGTASGAAATVAGGISNTASGRFSFVGAGSNNIASGESSCVASGDTGLASGESAFVGAGASLTASGDYSAAVGGSTNTASGICSVVTGGGSNTATASYATVGGGFASAASGQCSTIAGGTAHTATGENATVSGGTSNNATADNATVSGGTTNTASATFTTVAGGTGNTAGGTCSTVSGGTTNSIATSTNSVIGGGSNNTISGDFSTIAGGSGNQSNSIYNSVVGGASNIANGTYGAIGGGAINQTASIYATIGGGAGNTASGDSSVIPGGVSNTASGAYSAVLGRSSVASATGAIAIGRAATAGHAGALVMTDGSGTGAASTVANQLIQKFAGGIRQDFTGGTMRRTGYSSAANYSEVYQGQRTTTDNSAQTLDLVAIPTGQDVRLLGFIKGKRSTNADFICRTYDGCFANVGGVITTMTPVLNSVITNGGAVYTATIGLSGTTLRISFVGAAATTVYWTWHWEVFVGGAI